MPFLSFNSSLDFLFFADKKNDFVFIVDIYAVWVDGGGSGGGGKNFLIDYKTICLVQMTVQSIYQHQLSYCSIQFYYFSVVS